MITLDIQNLNTLQRDQLITSYQEKVAQLEFKVLKIRRAIYQQNQKEQKWLEEAAMYQKRREEGHAACLILTKSNPYYHKIRLDVQRCEIKIMELEIRLQRFSLLQKAQRLCRLMALEASINYYQSLIVALQNVTPVQNSQNLSHLLVDRPLGFGLLDEDKFSESADHVSMILLEMEQIV